MRVTLRLLRQHLHFIVVTTLAVLIITFPTIVYAFRADVFWLPVGNSNDVFFSFWDTWHIKQVLTGQADLFYTNALFYPQGLPLVYQSFFVPHAIVVNALQIFMPLSNAFCLAYLLVIFTSALSAYVYLLYLFTDKWIALFGALVFALSPYVVAKANLPSQAFVAPLPLVLYFFHRGFNEKRTSLIIIAGLFAGLTCAASLYNYVCLLVTLGLGILALAWTRWREYNYWGHVALLALVIGAASAWRILPVMGASQSLSNALVWHGTGEGRNDLISSFVNHAHPVLGPFWESALKTPDSGELSEYSYLGYVSLLLIGIGCFRPRIRRRMLPWLVLGAIFFVLRLGSTLQINQVTYADILLPKHFLDQVLPFAFAGFSQTDMFMAGILTPLAVLACYGLAAIQATFSVAKQPVFILLLIGVLALEYYVPVDEKTYPEDQFFFLDWLAEEENSEEIRLINLPMGRKNSKRYGLYQSLSGYPHVEGASNRTPPEAYNYIRQNRLLDGWSRNQPAGCETLGEDVYIAEWTRLQEDGFSHVVYHRRWAINIEQVANSFRNATPSYSDDYVSIYRLSDLRASCP